MYINENLPYSENKTLVFIFKSSPRPPFPGEEQGIQRV